MGWAMGRSNSKSAEPPHQAVVVAFGNAYALDFWK
jgi:hypothetical protein